MNMEYNSVITDFNRKVQEITVLSHAIPAIRQGVLLCRQTLSRLRDIVKQTGLNTQEAEIRFFKEIKAIPLSWLIYFTEIGSCELRKPRADRELQKQFYKKQLHKADKFFQRHREFVYYMEQGHTHRDPEYFTRKALEHFPLSTGIEGYRDPDFSTSHDLLWAQVQAMDRVTEHLEKNIEELSSGSFSVLNGDAGNYLAWTGTKTDLVVLIYALYSGKVINHGQADIAEITAAFETLFDIRLPQVYKTYAEIRMRKGQRLRFLEELIFRLSKKMDEDDAF
ncbi:hypothetical protein ED312_23280 [Sinomicrobium pectinilyticum]|uniref:Tetracycline regulation of excision, RteC n=2 Tax=Sinomicrobium pectinilyticum TaxID=1084421 RepID=A0A3N0CYC2_SINP1|nr:hypothetical protein ED312_23280 [Sinomicrobium pectinilyticum]